MASVFTHAFVALSLGSAILPRGAAARVWFIGAACAVIPDLDVIGFWWGIPYEHVLGHRGLTHSLAFAAILSGLLIAIGFRDRVWRTVRSRVWLYLFLATASHGFLDALTHGGLGIAFFAPFDDTRYLFPFRPIPAAPLSIAGFFTAEGLRILGSEVVWIWIPATVFIAIGWRYRKASIHPSHSARR